MGHENIVWWSHSYGHLSLLYCFKNLFIWHGRLQFLLSNSRMSVLAPKKDDVDHIVWDYLTQFEYSKWNKKNIKERELSKRH